MGVRFDRVYFNNIRWGIRMQRVADVSLEGVRSYSNTQIKFDDIQHDSNHNYDIRVNDFHYNWRTMDSDVAHPILSGIAVLHFEFGELVYISNCQMDMAGGAAASGMDPPRRRAYAEPRRGARRRSSEPAGTRRSATICSCSIPSPISSGLRPSSVKSVRRSC